MALLFFSSGGAERGRGREGGREAVGVGFARAEWSSNFNPPRALAPELPFDPIPVPILENHLRFEHQNERRKAIGAELRELVAR